jgi:hypothetical protein
MTANSGVTGVPGSEPPMLFAGFNVYLTLLGIIAPGVLGDMVGACNIEQTAVDVVGK